MKATTRSAGKDEVAHLKVGGPLISAEIPIRASLFDPLVRLFRRIPPEQLIQVPWGRAIVHVSDDDAGTIDVYLGAVNMTDRTVTVDQLHLERFTMGGIGSHITQPLFTPPPDPMRPHSVSELYLRVPLTAPAVRELLRVIQKAVTPYSSARFELTVSGRLGLTVGGSLSALQRQRSMRLPFTVPIRQPELNVNCPSARA